MKPPPLARWLWVRCAPRRLRDDVLWDLADEYHQFKRPELGAARAGVWYTYQIVSALVLLHTRYRPPPPSGPSPAGRGPSWEHLMHSLWQDVRYAVRMLTRAPGFTVVAIVTLAIGIGANSAIFSVVDAVLLAPLSYERPEHLVVVGGADPGTRDLRVSGPEFRDYLEGASSLSDLAAAYVIDANVTNGQRPERIALALTTPNFFSMFGAAPMLGRDFTPEDAGVDIGYVMVLSHAAWQRMFAGDPGVIGQAVRVDEDPIAIVGVMPEGFVHPGANPANPIEAWVPFDPTSSTFGRRRYRPLDVYGRLAAGVSRAESQAEFRGLGEVQRANYPDAYPSGGDWTIEVVSLLDRVVGNVRPTLLVLFGSVGFVLLIACTNVANLLLTRGSARARELAVRSALGGSRRRLARQLLSESIALAVAGGAVGLVLAGGGVRLLRRVASIDFPRVASATIDGNVILFTLAASIVASVAFGMAPTWRLSKPDFRRVLAEGGRGAARPRSGLRDGFVVAQISISLMLVIGAGLTFKSFARLLAVDPGFDPDRVLAMQVWLPRPNVPERGRFYRGEDRVTLFDRAIQRMEAVPEVERAAVVSHLPLRARGGAPFAIEGANPEDRAAAMTAEVRTVSADYFRVMSIPLLAGRTFAATDERAAPPVTLVNRALADRFFPDGAIGQRIRVRGGDPREIVGVVGSVRHQALDVFPRPAIYFPYRQGVGRSMTFVLKTAGAPEGVVAQATAALHEIDADLPLYAVAPMQSVIDETVAQRRWLMTLLSLFAALAAVLAAIGVYGVISYATRQRNREIGIRIALGADTTSVLGMVVRQGIRLGLWGAAIGLVGAAATTQVLQRFLFDVGRLDPTVFGTMAALAIGLAVVAALVPAQRAARVQPADVLRAE